MSPASHHFAQALPQVYQAAISAASCVARIMKDFLVRGEARILGAIASWYVSVAIMALLPTLRVEALAAHGRKEVRSLKAALVHLSHLWPTAATFLRGFQRLAALESVAKDDPPSHVGDANDAIDGNTMQAMQNLPGPSTSDPLPDADRIHGTAWHNYFPFITSNTSGLISHLLAHEDELVMENASWDNDPAFTLQDLFGQIAFGIELKRCKSITPELPGILTTIFDLEVYRSQVANQSFVQHATAGEQGCHFAIDSPLLVPALTLTCPDEILMQLVAVCHELSDYLSLRYDGHDVLFGHLLQPLHHEITIPAQCFKEGAMACKCTAQYSRRSMPSWPMVEY
ncbi:hypothetical protein LTR17_019957 [Elasticomyces elasticus]|nr:hypothetical protein LTR17_019957 [Elasticomyces elasticus]